MDSLESTDGDSFWSDCQDGDELFFGEDEEHNLIWQTDRGEQQLHQHFDLDTVLDQCDTSGFEDETSSIATDLTEKDEDSFLNPNDFPPQKCKKRKGRHKENEDDKETIKTPRKKKKPRVSHGKALVVFTIAFISY